MRKIRITSAAAILGAPAYIDIGFDISDEDGSFGVPDDPEAESGPAFMNTVMVQENTVHAGVRRAAHEVLRLRREQLTTLRRARELRKLLERHVSTFDLDPGGGE